MSALQIVQKSAHQSFASLWSVFLASAGRPRTSILTFTTENHLEHRTPNYTYEFLRVVGNLGVGPIARISHEKIGRHALWHIAIS